MSNESTTANRERVVNVFNGWVVLPFNLILLLGAIALFIYSLVAGMRELNHPYWAAFIIAILVEIVAVVMLPGFFTLQPNEARVLVLFGAYRGTVRKAGFHWGNPFYSNGRQLTWEYPRATPRGDQIDLVEVMDIAGGLITHHRVYWGWVGFKTLMAAAAARIER